MEVSLEKIWSDTMLMVVVGGLSKYASYDPADTQLLHESGIPMATDFKNPWHEVRRSCGDFRSFDDSLDEGPGCSERASCFPFHDSKIFVFAMRRTHWAILLASGT